MDVGDKGLFFLTLAIICFWLVLDQFLGKKRIGELVSSLIGDGSSPTTETMQDNYKETLDNQPTVEEKEDKSTGQKYKIKAQAGMGVGGGTLYVIVDENNNTVSIHNTKTEAENALKKLTGGK